MSLKDILRGTGVALVTPFNSRHEIDYNALHGLITFVIESGADYVVTLGTTGETPTLSRQEKIDIVKSTFEAVNSRVPVVVGVGGNNTREVIAEMEALPLDHSVAVLSASPYYNKPSQEGIFRHYKELAKASPRPVILYNVPGRTGSNITAPTTVRLAKEVENIGGIKEASGNMIQCMHILRDKPADFFVTSGDDHLTLPLISCGMDGVISVAANCFPRDFSAMVKAALDGDFTIAKGLHYKLLEGFDLLFAENNPAGVKAFLHGLGMIENHLRLPLVPLSDGLQKQVVSFLEKLNAQNKL